MRRPIAGLLSAIALALAPLAAAAASDTPQVGNPAIPRILHPYDETADATLAVEQALVAARSADKRTLIVFGANWCGDCKAFAGVLTLPSVKDWTDRHYQIVEVDVGHFDRNVDLAARFGLQLHAIPALVAVAQDGQVVNPTDMLALDDARSMTAQAVVDILGRWATAVPAS